VGDVALEALVQERAGPMARVLPAMEEETLTVERVVREREPAVLAVKHENWSDAPGPKCVFRNTSVNPQSAGQTASLLNVNVLGTVPTR